MSCEAAGDMEEWALVAGVEVDGMDGGAGMGMDRDIRK